ncbi:MAG: right-handed parallel beta-helix repeat-containing protein [Aldersonia sp.]|nr:right-handed parallel beta-helix repeat-containing protein [Aldersonia sp.]
MNKPGVLARAVPLAAGALGVVATVFLVLGILRLNDPPSPKPDRDPGPGPTTSAMPSARPLPDNADVVELPLGADLQAIVDEHPPGTHYRIAAGLHREQELLPKPGDVFVGEPGAVLSGARDISAEAVDWQQEGRWWVLEGQTQEGEDHGEIAEGGNMRDARPEELFVDGERFEHVASVNELAAGRWFFDYAADRIWIGEDPSTLGLIETSAAAAAIAGENVDDVTVSDITVEKYANRSSFGAINGLHSFGWQVRNCTARDNHGAGVSVGPGGLIEGCEIHGNGQLGLKVVGVIRRGADQGVSAPVSVRRNSIHHNRMLDYDNSWEAGALKIAECHQGVLFEENWVHDNDGPAVWFDVYNRAATIRGNLIERNRAHGIFYELSYGPTTIADNVVRHNGEPDADFPWASGIFVSNSRDVTVEGNVVYGNARGGISARSAGHRDPLVRNLVVRDNDIAFDGGFNGITLDRGAPGETFNTFGNRFEDNRYWTSSGSGGFAWAGSTSLPWSQGQSHGNDIDGALEEGPHDLDATTPLVTDLHFGAPRE